MHKHTAAAQAVQTAAYLDTVECVFSRITKQQWRRIRQYGLVKPCRSDDGRLQGYRLLVNLPKSKLPSKQTLLAVDRLAKKYGGVLSRFDLAVDTQMMNVEDAECLGAKIVKQAFLKWRRGGIMVDVETTTYWSNNEGKHRSSRNLVLYSDKENRLTGECEGCVHLELRFLCARTIRQQGIQRVKDLIKVRPDELFRRHVRWSNASDAAGRYVRKIVRRAAKKVRSQPPPRTKKTSQRIIDRYNANVARRMTWLLKRLDIDRAQILNQWVNLQPTEPIIAIPSALTWPSPPVV